MYRDRPLATQPGNINTLGTQVFYLLDFVSVTSNWHRSGAGLYGANLVAYGWGAEKGLHQDGSGNQLGHRYGDLNLSRLGLQTTNRHIAFVPSLYGGLELGGGAIAGYIGYGYYPRH